MRPTTASPPAWRATPDGNRSTGRNVRCSRQVGGKATASSAATPSVVPTDRTSWAVSGSLASGRPRLSGVKAR